MWAAVADIAELGRYSPETTHTEWLPGSDHHSVGAEFRGHNHNGTNGWHSDCVIVAYDEPTTFAFSVRSNAGYATIWTYTPSTTSPAARASPNLHLATARRPATGHEPGPSRRHGRDAEHDPAQHQTDIEHTRPNKRRPPMKEANHDQRPYR